MTLAECKCAVPKPKVRPGKADWCERCGYFIHPRWSCNSKTMGEFFDRLASALVTRDDTWARFRIDVEAREFAGRRRFGQSFQSRNNINEAMEEAADGALYACLDTLVARRAGDDEHSDLALAAALHFYRAYETLIHVAHRRRGEP